MIDQKIIYPSASVIRGVYCVSHKELVGDKKSEKCLLKWDCDKCSDSQSVIIIFDKCGYIHGKYESCPEDD